MSRNIAKILAVLVALVAVQLAAETTSHASSENDLWKLHEKGIQQVLQCFQQGEAPECYQYGLRSIVSSELALINKGVSPKHPNLVARTLNDLKSADDLPVFGWRIVKQRVAQRVGTPLSLWSSFEDEEFTVMLYKGEVPGGETTVRIKKYEGGIDHD